VVTAGLITSVRGRGMWLATPKNLAIGAGLPSRETPGAVIDAAKAEALWSLSRWNIDVWATTHLEHAIGGHTTQQPMKFEEPVYHRTPLSDAPLRFDDFCDQYKLANTSPGP